MADEQLTIAEKDKSGFTDGHEVVFELQTNEPFWKRLYFLVTNPFRYIFFGRIKY